MIEIGGAIDNRTICDVFGVANMGGIRVNKSRNLIVLISNITDPLYRNEWKDDVLHFVGMGATGPQKLDRQKKTLANTTRSGAAIHLFEVFETSRYVYAGEVELAGEPYRSDQTDARKESRFVWIFPLRKKQASAEPAYTEEPLSHLPYGAYAVVSSDLTDEQRALVDEVLDKLKEAGVPVLDRRDADRRRYEKMLGQWYEVVLDRVRARVKELIADKKHAARAAGREFVLVDDELRVNSASTETELRAALVFLDYDEPVAQEQLFEEARQAVPMPDPPKSLRDTNAGELEEPVLRGNFDRADFSDFT
jgi:hypothetical protein